MQEALENVVLMKYILKHFQSAIKLLLLVGNELASRRATHSD